MRGDPEGKGGEEKAKDSGKRELDEERSAGRGSDWVGKEGRVGKGR